VSIEYSLLGISPASGYYYKPTSRKSVSVPSSWVGRNDARCIGNRGIYTGKGGGGYELERSNRKREESGSLQFIAYPHFTSINTTVSYEPNIIPTYPGRWNRH
jgi:hypothetical protein